MKKQNKSLMDSTWFLLLVIFLGGLLFLLFK